LFIAFHESPADGHAPAPRLLPDLESTLGARATVGTRAVRLHRGTCGDRGVHERPSGDRLGRLRGAEWKPLGLLAPSRRGISRGGSTRPGALPRLVSQVVLWRSPRDRLSASG